MSQRDNYKDLYKKTKKTPNRAFIKRTLHLYISLISSSLETLLDIERICCHPALRADLRRTPNMFILGVIQCPIPEKYQIFNQLLHLRRSCVWADSPAGLVRRVPNESTCFACTHVRSMQQHVVKHLTRSCSAGPAPDGRTFTLHYTTANPLLAKGT